MPIHDYVIDNQSSAALRSDLNLALQAIVSHNSSTTAPTTTFANMVWYDVANKQLKKRNEANSAWITLGTINEVGGTFTPSGTSGITLDINNTISINSGSGVTGSVDNDGTPALSSTYTPTPIGGNFKSITNNAAFTLASPTAAGDYTMVIQITNGATPGAITMSGFERVTGDSFTTTVGHDFFVFITKCNGFEAANVVALQ